MMIALPKRLLAALLLLSCVLLPGAVGQTNTSQQLVFAGLRSAGMQGQFNGVQADGSGNLFVLLNSGDGVRVLKTDGSGSAVLAQAVLGAKGDIGLALTLDPAGNVYVAGTTFSTALMATAGAAIPTRTDSSTNSFVAKFDANLNPLFVTFTGGSKISAVAVTATADAVFVTGTTYAANLPVTANGIQQAPASGSTANGFVERFSASGTTLVYATYLTGANGDTNPAAIAADTADDVYVGGETSASGYPTVAALVPAILSSPSGFATKLTPAGDAITFSTFVPGMGLTSVALDASRSSLLLAGSVALGQFPVDTVAAPVAELAGYQVLVRMALDGSSVLSSTLLAPGTQSFVAATAAGGAWVAGALTTPLFPLAPLSDTGMIFGERLSPAAGSAYSINETARFGGLPNGNVTYASLTALPTSIAVDTTGDPVFAGAVQPSASSSLLASETFDVPLRNAPTTALPSSVASAEQTAATCQGSLCAGSAAYLAKLNPNASGVSLAISAGAVPFVVLRNLGSASATGLQVTATGSTVISDCAATLAAGGECDALLSGGAAGTLTVSAGGDTQTVAFNAYTAPAATIVFYPKELDFGIVTPGPAQRVITVSNLGTASQTFTSALQAGGVSAPFSEASSDCTLAGSATSKVLAAGGTCHITIALTSSADAAVQANWAIGSGDVLLTGYEQSTVLGVSAAEVDFGTEFVGGLRLPRYLYLSNSSATPVSHAPPVLPVGSPFSLTDSCPATLVAGSVCRLRIDYLNRTPASDSATLALDDGLSVLLTGKTLPQQGVAGSSVNPNLSVAPMAVTFANPVPVTAISSETQTVTIRNTGAGPFSLTLALSGDFSEVTSCGATLAGGATCAVTLTFVPSQPGQRTGLLAVTAGAGTTPVYVSIAAVATAILPANNGTLALGSTPVGQPVVQFFKVSQPFGALTATTTGPFTVDLIEDTGYGPGSPPASAFAASVTGTCRNCYLAVEFTPTAAGAQAGTLTLSSDPAGTPYTLALSGTGTALTGLVLTPGSQDFGAVPVHSSSGAVTFTATNLTAGTLTVATPTVTGDFAISTMMTGQQACAGALAAGASCVVSVQFAPAAAGTRTGALTVGTATAPLTGVGSADPGVGVNPLSLTFNNIPGTQATVQTVSVTNTGTQVVAAGAPTTGTASFSAASNCATLAPGASCTVTVTYHPGTASASDTLAIPVNGTVYTVALAGTYTASSAGLQVVPGVSNFGPSPTGIETAARQITINNNTTKTFALQVVIPRQFVLTGAPCTSLAPGAACSFTVAFLPLTNGDIPGSVTVQATPSDGSAMLSSIAYLEGYGVGSGQLALTGGLISSGTFNFGQVASGQTAAQTFTVINTSATANLTVRRVTSAPPFDSSTTCGATLLPGATCTVTVTYTPVNQVATGTASPPSTTDTGALTIESDAASSPTLLNLAGQAGAAGVTSPSNPAILATYTLSQASLSFASTTVGDTSAAQTITLTNTGTVALTVQAIGATPDFTVSSTCASVAAGASCMISVTSTPQTAGTHIASLEIASTAATSLEFVSLVSTADASPLLLAPASLAFGTAVVGTSTQLPVQVTNSGTVPITFGAITASGDYSAGGSCPAAGGTLAAGASCTVLVTFTPSATGARPGTLSIVSSASTAPRTVALTGAGSQSKLVIAPSALAFGSLVVGASSNLSVTLTNSGSAAVTALSLSATGDYSVSLPCPATLAAGTSCTAQITFTPTVIGVRPGTLLVTSSDPSSPASVALTGTGILAGSFTLTVDGGPASSATVSSGKPATYHLTVTPTGSFSGAVALTCAPVNAAQFASCSLTPASLTLAGAPQTSIATLNTITSVGGNAQLQRSHGDSAGVMLCLLLPGVWAFWWRGRQVRVSLPALASVLLLGAALLVSGCGGKNDFDTRYTPAGTYQYQVTAVSTSGIQITQTVTLNLIVTPR